MPLELKVKRAARIWVHAASVGEVMAALPVIKLIRQRLPEWEIIISTITPGGHETARQQMSDIARAVVYLPFDLPWTMKRALDAIQPDILCIFETELWPNLTYETKQRGARIALINGRISDRSIGRYRKLRSLFRWTLSQFDLLLAQSERDAGRIQDIGGDPARVKVFGNTKFDEAPAPLNPSEVEALRMDLRLSPAAPVLVVGSTRTPEEERSVLEAYVAARGRIPELALIHAPRHVERSDELARMMRGFGLDPVRRSQVGAERTAVQHLILDTFGELSRVYALADVVYIGNSLNAPGGGQNLLQPLSQGKPVIHGPHMSNFRDITAMASEAGVAWQVLDEAVLADTICMLTQDNSLRRDVTARAIDLVERNRGAAARYADAIISLANVANSPHLEVVGTP